MLRKRTPNAGVNQDNTVVNDFHRKDTILSTAHAQLHSLTYVFQQIPRTSQDLLQYFQHSNVS